MKDFLTGAAAPLGIVSSTTIRERSFSYLFDETLDVKLLKVANHADRERAGLRTVNEGRRAAKRAHILLVAERRFAKNGFHATGMAEICAAAKMSPGNLYRYFKSKDEIVRAIVERDRLEFVALAARVGRDGDIVASIVDLAEEFMRRAAKPGYARVAVEVLAEAGRDKTTGEFYRKADKEILATLETALKSAARAGRLHPGLDCKAAACWLVALADGTVARFAADGATDRRALVPALRQLIVRFLSRPNAEG